MNSPLDFIHLLEQHSNVECREKTIERNEYLTKAGSIENHIYVVLSGAVRAFYVSDKEEFTIRFGYQDSIINSISSFITQEPSELYIQALRKTTVKLIPRSAYNDFVNSSKEILQIHNALISGVVVSQMERELDLLTASPLDRYQRVLQRSPQLFQEIPLKYIASYLRMTPETLSRLRSS